LAGEYINYNAETPWERDDVLNNLQFAPVANLNSYNVTVQSNNSEY
jgi:hypothetical protein